MCRDEGVYTWLVMVDVYVVDITSREAKVRKVDDAQATKRGWTLDRIYAGRGWRSRPKFAQKRPRARACDTNTSQLHSSSALHCTYLLTVNSPTSASAFAAAAHLPSLPGPEFCCFYTTFQHAIRASRSSAQYAQPRLREGMSPRESSDALCAHDAPWTSTAPRQ
jgi:hypothetical protein